MLPRNEAIIRNQGIKISRLISLLKEVELKPQRHPEFGYYMGKNICRWCDAVADNEGVVKHNKYCDYVNAVYFNVMEDVK